MDWSSHGGAYPAATRNDAGNTSPRDDCMSIGVMLGPALTWVPVRDVLGMNGMGTTEGCFKVGAVIRDATGCSTQNHGPCV